MSKSKIMIIEKLYMNNRCIGYFVFDYNDLNFKTIDSFSKYIVWGKVDKDLKGYKNIPWYDIHEGYVSERCAVVLGRAKEDSHTIIYFVRGYGVNIDKDTVFLSKLRKNNIRCTNIIKSQNIVRSLCGEFPEIDLNLLKNKMYKRMRSSMLSDLEIQAIKDKKYREKLLTEKYMAETSELENELLLKVSRDSKKNKEFSYRFVNNASLYLGDVLGDKLLNKRTLAEANYYIYPTNLFKDIENFQQSPCTEKVCKELIDKCKSILDNYLLSEEEQLNQVRNVINVSIDGVKNFNQFCQFCDSMMRILTSGYFDSSQKGGVTLLGNPNNIYINSNAVNRFELRYFYVIIHEYLHLITMKGNKSGISDLDSEDSVLLNILNEGITDIFAGLFTYYCCARMYRDNKESGRKFYLYENGVVLSLKEIEERVSPFLKDLKTVKNFKDISEVLIELQQGKLNLKYETNKLYEGPYYSNIIVIYFLMQKVGIDYFYKSYFANDFELLDSYLITKLSIYWREIKDNISTSINVNFMDSMLLIKVLKIIEKAGV